MIVKVLVTGALLHEPKVHRLIREFWQILLVWYLLSVGTVQTPSNFKQLYKKSRHPVMHFLNSGVLVGNCARIRFQQADLKATALFRCFQSCTMNDQKKIAH